MRYLLLLCLLLGAIAGCPASDSPTGVLIIIDAAPGVRAASSDLRITVRGAPKGSSAYTERYQTQVADVKWPYRAGLAPQSGNAARQFELQADAYGARNEFVASVRVRSGYVAGKQLTLHLLLEDACIGVRCADDETCKSGACVDNYVKPGDLDGGKPDMDAQVGPVDSATPPADGSASDGSSPSDGGQTCATECDDRDACNGLETCSGGQCIPGTPKDCDDAVACTADKCIEGSCRSTPDNTVCTVAMGGRCDMTNGCQYLTCTQDTCAANGCEDATCDGDRCVRTSKCGDSQVCCANSCVKAGCTDDNACTDDACRPSGCVHTNNAINCDDGNLCTTSDVCGGGACKGSPGCDDRNPCTDDGCGKLGCTYQNNAMSCEDKDLCTIKEVCSGGACTGISRCDDGNQCTTDTCDPAMGLCSNVSNTNSCDLAVEPTDRCLVGGCVEGSCKEVPVSCRKGLVCCNGECVVSGGIGICLPG